MTKTSDRGKLQRGVALTLTLTLLLGHIILPARAFAADGEVHLTIGTVDTRPISIERLLYTAFADAGIYASYQSGTLLEGYEAANASEIDGVLSAAPDVLSLYGNLVKVPYPLEKTYLYALTREGGRPIDGWEDLSGLSVGVIAQRPFIMGRLPADVSPAMADTNESLMKGLLNSEYDAAIIAVRSTETFEPMEGLVVSERIEGLDEYLYLNKACESVIPALLASLERLHEDGRAERILDDAYYYINPRKTIVQIVSSSLDDPDEEQFIKELRGRFRGYDDVEWYTMELNTKRSAADANRLVYLSRLLKQDCVSRNVAAVVVSGETALDFLESSYYLMFRNTPVLFYKVNENRAKSLERFAPYIKGIYERVPAHEVVSEALRLFPETERFYVINDHTAEGQVYRQETQKLLGDRYVGVEVLYNDYVSLDSLMAQIKGLPERSVVLAGTYSRDSMEQFYSTSEIERIFEHGCPFPIFTINSSAPRYDALAGLCSDYSTQGVLLADALEAALFGSQPPELDSDPNRYLRWVFDIERMADYGVTEADLPEGAIIGNAPLSVWESDPEFAWTLVGLAVLGILVSVFVMMALFKFRQQKERIANAEALLEKDASIREVKERLENIINAAPVAYLMTLDDKVMEANEYVRGYLGVMPGDDIKSFYTDVRQRERLFKLAENNRPVRNEIIRFNTTDGQSKRFLANFASVDYEHKRGYILWGLDIENRERQKDALTMSQRANRSVTSRLERIIVTSPFMFMIAVDGAVAELNTNAHEKLGLEIGDEIGRICADPEGRDYLFRHIMRVGVLRNEQVRLKLKNGEVHRFFINAAVSDYDGHKSAVVWAVDMERTEAQKDELNVARRSLQTMIDTMPAAVALLDVETRELLYANDSCGRMFGYLNDGRLYGENASMFLPELQRDGTPSSEILDRIIRSVGPTTTDCDFITSDGGIIEGRAVTCEIEYRGRRASLGILRDLKDLKELQRTKQSLQTILDTMPAPLAIIDPESFTFLYANKSFLRMHEMDSIEQVIGRTVYDTLTAEQSEGRSARELCEYCVASADAVEAEMTSLTAKGNTVDTRIITTHISYNGKSAVIGIFTNLTREKQYRLAQENLQKILDSMPVPVRLMDLETMSFVYANRSCMELFGHESLEEACGHISETTLPVQPGGITLPQLEQFIRTAADAISRECAYVTAEGRHISALMTTVVIDYNGRPTSVSIIRDLAEQKQYERMLLSAAEKEKEANLLKSRFLVNMSHEIRTPMNAIIGLTEIELRKRGAEQPKEVYRKIKDSAKNLLEIINDILDLSKIEADRIELYSEEFELEDVLSSALLVAAPRLDGKRVELILNGSLDLPRFLIGDRTRLWQILKNFLDNSAKFTEKGKIILSVSARDEGRDTIPVTFIIEDTGIGMDEEQLTRVFRPYEQIYSDAQKRYTGTGLGMAISKQLCELMGGRLEVESVPAKGSRILIEIPFKRSERTEIERDAVRIEALSGMKILAVDDDPVSRSVIRALITNTGASCVEAESGEQAIEIILDMRDKGEGFDLILLDYVMDGIDGLETARRIKTSLTRAPKLLLVTAFQRLLLSEQLEQSNIYEVIEKPIIPTIFMRRLSEAVGVAGVVFEDDSESFARFEGVTVLLCEDYELNQEVAVSMLEQFGISTIIANNGREGIDILNSGESVDLVFMDLQMPVMDGYEATRGIRENPRFDGLPIISMTADAMKEVVDRCAEAGMDDHVVKPVEFSSLQRVLVKWLPESKRAGNAAKTAKTGETEKTAKTEKTGDGGNRALARFGGDAALYNSKLLELARELPDVWPDFEAALEKAGELKEFAHKIIGAAGNLDETELCESARQFCASLDGGATDEASGGAYARLVAACGEFKARCVGGAGGVGME